MLLESARCHCARGQNNVPGHHTYAPVRVVVWTRQGEASDNINAEALEWARSQPEKDLISPDGRK